MVVVVAWRYCNLPESGYTTKFLTFSFLNGWLRAGLVKNLASAPATKGSLLRRRIPPFCRAVGYGKAETSRARRGGTGAPGVLALRREGSEIVREAFVEAIAVAAATKKGSLGYHA
jgi:hypothetical protein